MSKSDSNLESEDIAKKEDNAGLASGGCVPGTKNSEIPERIRREPTCENFKHAGTCLRQGAADFKAQAPLPPARQKEA